MTTGLEGVEVTQTHLSRVDGIKGELVLRGRRLEELAGKVSYESVCGLLWEEEEVELGRARALAYAQLESWFERTDGLTYPGALRLLLTVLRPESEVQPHHLAAGAVAVGLANVIRRRRGGAPVPPRTDGGQAQSLLEMLEGGPVEQSRWKALEAYLVTVAEHGLNPSTFTARVIASTGAELFPTLVGALSALEGPLHGGAPGPVLDMLDACQADPRGWIREQLARGQRLMGFGHRVYRVRDPRAEVLKQAVLRLAQSPRLTQAETVERVALEELARHKPGRRLETNVEFYTAVLLEAVGLPREAFTGVFAVGRVAGWSAHFYEQRHGGRLLRPVARYVGPEPASVEG